MGKESRGVIVMAKFKVPNVAKLIISLLLCLLAGYLGSIFTTPAIAGWYSTITKASFNPPNWIFAPVWTALFLLMGISLYLVWTKGEIKSKRKLIKPALWAFGIQLALNVLWSILFFGMKSPFYAFIDILVLWAAIFMTIRAFGKVSKAAAWFLLPYILWVSFAVILNLSIVLLNS